MINRKSTFDSIRKSFGKLTITQVEGFTEITIIYDLEENDTIYITGFN